MRPDSIFLPIGQRDNELTDLPSHSFTRKSSQLWRYIADRAAVMAISNLPVMWLFSTRNNCLLWATSWEFGTFNTFHRWIGRACAIEVFVHGVSIRIFSEEALEKLSPSWIGVDKV